MKTISETILSFPGLEDGSDFLEKVLVDRSLTGADNYTVSEKRQVELAAADMYSFFVNSYDFTENKLEVKYPRKHFRETAVRLYRANGEPENANALLRKFRITARATNKW